MAEAIIIDRVSAASNWDEVCRDLQQEASLKGAAVKDLVRDILISDGYGEIADIDSVEWGHLVGIASSTPAEDP